VIVFMTNKLIGMNACAILDYCLRDLILLDFIHEFVQDTIMSLWSFLYI
jgi:hypothetical protein